MFKENVGLPMGEGHGGATYFMFEVHYDNPEEKECKFCLSSRRDDEDVKVLN